MSEISFLDTNILCYSKDTTDLTKHKVACKLIEKLVKGKLIRISSQVISEYYVFLRKCSSTVAEKLIARASAEALMAFKPTAIDQELQQKAWAIEERFQLSWWDAMIVAAAIKSRAEILYTEDLQHGQKFEKVRVINPFA